jgi:hypothetical protein
MISGILGFITRLVPKLKWTHIYVGRLYIVSMLWATATSLLIHNTGLPLGVLISFIWVLSGLVIGWVVINFHQVILYKKAVAHVESKLAAGTKVGLAAMIQEAKDSIQARKTFYERLFSLKTLHGVLMFTSWINIAGRVFVTPINYDFECFTYPAYKPINTSENQGLNQPLKLVPEADPAYNRLPWANSEARWGVMLSVGPMAAAFIFGAIYAWIISKRLKTSVNAE